MTETYCRMCHSEGCKVSKSKIPIPRKRQKYEVHNCDFYKLMEGETRDKSVNMRIFSLRREDPDKNPSEVFMSRVKLLRRHMVEIEFTPLPLPTSRDKSAAGTLSDSQMLAWARAFKLMPDVRLNEASKKADLRKKVKQEIEKQGQIEDTFEDIKVFRSSLALECSKCSFGSSNESNPLSHLTAAGYPNTFTDPLKILGENCQYAGCNGKYQWKNIPTKNQTASGRNERRKPNPPKPRSR